MEVPGSWPSASATALQKDIVKLDLHGTPGGVLRSYILRVV